MGCGGIGGVIAGHLAELGLDVTAISRNQAVVDAVSSRGLQLRGEGGERSVPVRTLTEVPREERFDWVLLATQPQDVEQAARQALPSLSAEGRLVVLQNGLCEERVARVANDAGRVVGGIVAWGASMVEPGVYDRTSSGGFTLGRLDGRDDVRLDALATPLEAIGEVQRTHNLAGARWSKLALNCTISSLGALSGERLGWLVQKRNIRRLALEIMSEVVTVAQRLDVKLEKVSGTLDLDWMALTRDERRQVIGSMGLASKHAMLLAVGLRYRRLRSSMLSAIERGREPPIAFLNGEVVERGERLGVPTPVNRAICDRLATIGAGHQRPARHHVLDLFHETRPAVAALAA
ncbi:MAG: 2-dehydropantoate 2-reductase [Myxococcales bacterium]|nr:2-dehydropantoate 2-reductase [Myxococcales bacterium]